MNVKKLLGSKSGYTIAEVVISALILMLVSTAFFGAVITGLRAQATSTEYYRASCIARNQIQYAKTLDFGSISRLYESMEPIDDDGDYDVNGEFRRSITISNLSDKCLELTVDVYFPIYNRTLSASPSTVKTKIYEGM